MDNNLNFHNLSISNLLPVTVTNNGVFATRDIKRGEKICYYPIDAIENYYGEWKYFNNNEFKITHKHDIRITTHLKNNFNNVYDLYDEELEDKMLNQFELADEHYGNYCNNSCKIFTLMGTSNDIIHNDYGVGHLINDSSSNNTNPLQDHSLFLEESRKPQNVMWNNHLKKYEIGGIVYYGLDIYAIKNISRGEELLMFYNDYVEKITSTSKLGVFASKVAKDYAERNNMDMTSINSGGSGKNGKFTKKDLETILGGYGNIKNK